MAAPRYGGPKPGWPLMAQTAAGDEENSSGLQMATLDDDGGGGRWR